MNRVLTLILSIIMVLLILGSAIGLWSYRKSKFEEENKSIQAQIEKKQAELDSIKTEVDKNGYRPADVVINFFEEIKSKDVDVSSLYLSSQYNSVMAERSLNFDFKTDEPIIKDTNSSISEADGKATVNVSFSVKGSSGYKTRLFYLIKEDETWKILKIKEISES